MGVQTGRTTFKFLTFSVDDSAGTLRQIPINSLSVVGVVYDEVEMFAWQDAVKGALVGMANCPIDIGGPFDTTASTGSHTVLSAINGLIPATYLSLNISIGIRQAYAAGEPTFGITGTAANGFLCFGYTVDFGTGQYTAHFNTAPASTLPAWGIAAYT
jgi:hypothetical protein